ncbi:hypothetical protein TUMSATVNIG3_52030 [Vibrio nigripulchritudo]|nr:hypothetical protein TUMSATVNIG2_51370 [Vibrio nigripulchritudo]BDU46405.1 hypothetical protein TUMSATVNIG3_52030 [Vibrio nigripulchritudo]
MLRFAKFLFVFLSAAVSAPSLASSGLVTEKLCNKLKRNWYDSNNMIVAGYEYCLRGSYGHIVNLTSSPLYIHNPRDPSKIYEVDASSRLRLEPRAIPSLNLLTRLNGRVYLVGDKLVVSTYDTANETKGYYRSVINSLRGSRIKYVSKFRVREMSYDSKVFFDSPIPGFEKVQRSALPVVVAVGIGGAGAGALDAWDPDNACFGDILRGAFEGGVSSVLGALIAIPGGMGTIVGMVSGGAVSKVVQATCSQCHKSYCGKH